MAKSEGLNSPQQSAPRPVTDQEKGESFVICLDDKLFGNRISALGLGKDDLFICRDVALTDELAANVALQSNLKTI